MATKIFFVDDEKLLLESLEVFFSSAEDFEVTGSAQSGEEALQKLELLQPDLAVVDLNMTGIGGIRLIGEIKRRWSHVRILVLSTYYDDYNITSAIAEGADGYILKSFGSGEIINAARMVARGHTVLDRKVMSVLHVNARKSAGYSAGEEDQDELRFREVYSNLTEREREICSLIQKGRSNREIADALHITEGTVKNYLSGIYCTLGLRDRTALAVAITRSRAPEA